MIRYALVCDKGHEFEGWFRSSADFDAQQTRGLLACGCGSTHVTKALMAPAVAPAAEPAAAAAPVPAEQVAVMKTDPRDKAMRAMLRQMREHILSKTEDVGERFAEEARKIHYEEDGTRAIRGRTTPDEARALLDEGITVAPMPVLPDDHH